MQELGARRAGDASSQPATGRARLLGCGASWRGGESETVAPRDCSGADQVAPATQVGEEKGEEKGEVLAIACTAASGICGLADGRVVEVAVPQHGSVRQYTP